MLNMLEKEHLSWEKKKKKFEIAQLLDRDEIEMIKMN